MNILKEKNLVLPTTELKAKYIDLRFNFYLEFGTSANALSLLNIIIDRGSVYLSSCFFFFFSWIALAYRMS